MRTGPHTTLADQTAGWATCPWHDKLVSALEDQTAEICTAQGQSAPAFYTRRVQKSVRVRIIMPPYFPLSFVSLQSEEQLGVAVLPKE